MAKCYFYNEDCLQSMKRMQEKGFKVDLLLSSPPYNSGRKSNSKRSLENYEARYDIYLDDMTDEEYCNWTISLFNNFDKILNENGVVLWNVSYGNEAPNCIWLSLLSILEKTNFMIADVIVWKKKSCLPNNVSSHLLSRICEFIFVICRKDEYKTYNANKEIKSISKTGQKYYENIYNFIEAANNDGSCKLNKATYSSELCEKLLKIYAKRDCIVYDPFMGTGTTAIACEKYGNDNMMCIGSEISEQQVEYSKERLETYRKQHPKMPSLFNDLEIEENGKD